MRTGSFTRRAGREQGAGGPVAYERVAARAESVSRTHDLT
jgi:hypothetical protein